ncbi:GNAT family N-acetyltransferase [Herbaspirillum rhizosphaerae]|uniref:GNAT family N-acetyltransferase n=1 Tax=Herbaspirillum rhizosphaerae TaxID=346179 RepID=UPI00067C7BB0|nr:GNAT family N-acetyltransferase [Herbaspirillum rhizosphaerae]
MDGTITTRHAVPGDAQALCAAERKTGKTPGLLISLPHEFSVSSFEDKIAWLATAGVYLVAELNGEMAGHALLEPLPLSAMSHVFSLTVVVHPGHTGRGVGTHLMGAVLQWSEDHPAVEKIELRVRESNAVARHLYRRFGFVEEGRFEKRIKLPDGTYLADVCMARFSKK